MIYYGDEAAINAPGLGAADPFNRAPSLVGCEWRSEHVRPRRYVDDRLLLEAGTIRHELPALRTGSFERVLANDAAGVYAFGRTGSGAKPVIVALNKSGSRRDVVLRIGRFYSDGTSVEDRIGGATSTVTGGTVRVSLAARSGAVLAGR